jgi:hypothetical protein
MGARKDYRELARQIINNRKYSLDIVERVMMMFENLDNPSWWDKMLIGYIAGICA